MKSRLTIFLFLFACMPVSLHADLLDDLLDRSTFKPKTLSEAQMDSILNPNVKDEAPRYVLEYEDEETIWRHSTLATAYIRDTQRGKRWKMCEEKVRDCVMSPNGKYIVYGKQDGNLYIYKLDFKTEVPITQDNYDEDGNVIFANPAGISPSTPAVTKIYNGVTDWLYEEEFATTTTVCWSEDSQTMAFVRLNDTEVPIRQWGPYPRAGEPNPQASVCIYDVFYKRILTIELPEMDEAYIPRLWWESKVSGKTTTHSLYLKRLNRDQNKMEVFSVNPKSGVASLRKTVTNPTGWVDVDDVEAQPNRRYSRDGKRYIEWTESVSQPTVYTLYDKKGKKLRVLEDNAEVKARWEALGLPEKEFFSFVSERGDTLKGWMLKPQDGRVYDAEGKVVGQDCMLRRYPVVMTQYSGPGSRRVVDKWSKRFEYYLASIGYIVVCVDPRGTEGRGKEWLEQTYMNLGKKEAEDQIATAHYMASQDYVDVERISMIGWSYGGYQVIRTLEEQGLRQQTLNEAPLIRRGVAIAPVTDWRLYDSAYTERYMRRPQVNETGYQQADLRTHAEYLTGDLLIMHGLADDNVHPDHTIQLIESLVDAGKYFELMMYPDDNHFLKKGRHYRDVHERLIRFIGE